MMKDFLSKLGLSKNQNIIVHSAFKKIRSAFPGATPTILINTIEEMIGTNGSLIMPAFTYCFKSTDGRHEIFDRLNSPAKVGTVADIFRQSENVIRTSSPTHSFSLWGKINSEIAVDNSPDSPLGGGSVLDWIAKQDNSFVLLLGTNFDSLSFCHYLEVKAIVPWFDTFPWDHLGKPKIGISTQGEQPLKEVPGCSKSFINFESYLLESNYIKTFCKDELYVYFIPVPLLLEVGINYFSHNYERLLCKKGTCKPCDFRRDKHLT